MRLEDLKNRILTLGLIAMVLISSCEKYEDSSQNDWKVDENQEYCNHPDAVNYNWGFPGVINDSICIFPNEVFEGQWYLTDTLFNDTLGVEAIRERFIDIQWVPEDSIEYKLRLSGWCDNEHELYLDANRFLLASVIDELEDYPGQWDCDLTSSISGTIRKNNFDADTLYLQMIQQTDQDQLRIIKGRAIKN